jgi:uncharacterized membrane protein YeaQ/YmgE (transglycosylase-associated protein family)
MLHAIGFVVFGLVIGLLARALMPGKDRMGWVATGVLGIIGAVAAGWIGRAMGWYGPGDGAGFIASFVGAFVLLLIYNRVVARRGGSISRMGRGGGSIDRAA